MIYILQLIFLISVVANFCSASIGSINLPGVLYNAANGQRATASSFYDYKENPIFSFKYEPDKAIDGQVMQSSWWSSGDVDESVYWQLNFTVAPWEIKRIVVRWHGYQSAKQYRIRTAYGESIFRTLATVRNASAVWDRVDVVEGQPIESIRYMRIQMDEPNVCNQETGCLSSNLDGNLSQKDIYGIREVEVWGVGFTNGAIQGEVLPGAWFQNLMITFTVVLTQV